MRNLKRALSLAVASVMLLGMMVVGSGAASFTDVDSKDNVEAIEVAKAVGIMVGDNKGNFNPDNKVNRVEMAVVMANMLDLKVSDFKGVKTPFTDVPDWAAPYVAACYADGIVAGTSATTYGSYDAVAAVQAGLMMMKALGYFQRTGDFEGNWTVATMKQASKIGLYADIDTSSSAALTRNEVAQLALNALESDMVETEGGGLNIDMPGISITQDPAKYTVVAATKDVDYNASKDGDKQLCEQLFGKDLKKNSKSDDFGREGSTWTYKKDEVVFAAAEADVTYTASVKYEDIYSDLGLDEATKATVKIDGEFVKVTAEGEDESKTQVIEIDDVNTKLAGAGNGVLVEVYLVEGDTADTIKIVMINTYVGEINGIEDEDEDDRAIVIDALITGTEDGNYETQAFDEDDIVLYTYANGKVQSVELAEMVEDAKVSNKTATSKFIADGTTYKVAFTNEVAVEVKSSYDIYLDAYGYAAYTTLFDSESSDFAYVMHIAVDGGFGEADEDAVYYANLLLADGTVVKKVETDATDAKGDDSWASYTIDKDGVYELDFETTISTTSIVLKKGVAGFTTTGGKDSNSFNSNSKTVFVIYNGDDYTAYTGIKTVPDVTSASKVKLVNDDNMVTFVYIKTTDSEIGGSSSDDIYVYVKWDEKEKIKLGDMITDSDKGSYYAFDAVIDGEITKLNVAKSYAEDDAEDGFAAEVGEGVLSKISYNGKDLVTGVSDVTGEANIKSAETTKKASGGTIGLGDTYYAYADDVKVFKIDDGIADSSITAIKNETVKVIFTLDDGVVTSIYIIK